MDWRNSIEIDIHERFMSNEISKKEAVELLKELHTMSIPEFESPLGSSKPVKSSHKGMLIGTPYYKQEPETKKEDAEMALSKGEKEWGTFDKIAGSNTIRRILMFGPPGTGKTTGAVRSATDVDGGQNHYNITLHDESSVADVIGHWIPKGSEFEWHNGPAMRAWREGKLLVVNEIDHSSDSVMSVMHAVMDDIGIAHMTLPNGETVAPKEGFRVIATMNGIPSDLPDALEDRFDIMLNISMPSKEAIKALPVDLQTLAKNAYSKKTINITYRQIQAFAQLREIVGEKDAATVVFRKLASDVLNVVKVGQRGVDV